MDLYMYNVEFGDAFLICEQDENLLIDLGSDWSGYSFTSVIDDIASRSKGKKLSLMISHFHQDHVNGLWDNDFYFKKKIGNIERVYLPDILTASTHGEIDLVKIHIVSNFLKAVILQQRPLQITLYTLLQSLLSINAAITFLHRGSCFTLGHKHYDVLSPIYGNLVHRRTSSAIITLFQEIEEEIKSESEITTFALIEKFSAAISHGFKSMTDSIPYEGHKPPEDLTILFEQLDEKSKNIAYRLSEKTVQRIRRLIPLLHKIENEMSIVFHNSYGASKNILMTGDATTSVLNKIIRNDFHDGYDLHSEYNIIKAPHHGTKTHFTPLFPPSDNILISNGQPSHNQFGKISYQYCTVYNCNPSRNTSIQCTNDRCCLKEKLKRNCLHGCTVRTGGSYFKNFKL